MYRNQCGQQVYTQNMFSTMCLFPDHLSSELCPEGYVCVSIRRDFSLPDHSTRLIPEAIFCFRITLLPNFLTKLVCVHPKRFLASGSPHPAQSGSDLLLPDHLSSELSPKACVYVDPKRFLVFRLSSGRRNVQA